PVASPVSPLQEITSPAPSVSPVVSPTVPAVPPTPVAPTPAAPSAPAAPRSEAQIPSTPAGNPLAEDPDQVISPGSK
ncbi:MAG: hypothetical protein WAV56_02245, partial [Microgenomates group bacterium]